MRHSWSGFVLLLSLATLADAQITRTATFENFTLRQDLGSSFTDPLSGISFSNSTSTIHKFGIDNGLPMFPGSNYLGNGGGGLPAYFGFTANLPSLADEVSVEAAWIGTPPGSSGIMLEGYSGPNATGTLIAQQTIPNASDPFTLQITSDHYDIASFKVKSSIFSAYDNISYTILPEPTSASLLILGIGLFARRQRA